MPNKSARAWDQFIEAAPQRRGVDRAVGHFLLVNWKLLGPVIVWIVAQVVGYNVMRSDLAMTKKQVDLVYRYILWGQRSNVGPPPPIEKEE